MIAEFLLAQGSYHYCHYHYPADTKHNIYIVFMLEGYVKIMLDFMLECLVFLT